MLQFASLILAHTLDKKSASPKAKTTAYTQKHALYIIVGILKKAETKTLK